MPISKCEYITLALEMITESLLLNREETVTDLEEGSTNEISSRQLVNLAQRMKRQGRKVKRIEGISLVRREVDEKQRGCLWNQARDLGKGWGRAFGGNAELP